jgi:F-type H+-transporting ATPase subunit epsilon
LCLIFTVFDGMNSPNQLHVEIVSPEGSVLSANADGVEFRGTEGELGILPGHTLLLTALDTGELRIYQGQKVQVFLVAGGFAQVHPDSVRIVATFASTSDEQNIEAACQRARQALEIAATEPPSVIEAELIELKEEFVRMKQTQKRRHRSAP